LGDVIFSKESPPSGSIRLQAALLDLSRRSAARLHGNAACALD